MQSLCPIHNVPFRQVPAGVSKKTGKAYSAFMACPEIGCKEKPQEQIQSQPAVREQTNPISTVYKNVQYDTKMTKEDWEAKEARTNKNILLQVAFKAAVEMGYKDSEQIFNKALEFYNWLLSQTEGQKVVATPRSVRVVDVRGEAPSEDEVNKMIEDAQAEENIDMEY